MIKHQGNIQNLIKQLKDNKNNAVAHIFEDNKFSEGKLNNATVILKDVFATADAPTTASSKILEGFKPKYDADVVRKLREAGSAIVGKVHSDELALGGTGEFSAFGLIANPLDNKRMAGGSSSGNVATFTNDVSISIGSDTGDSVRVPASFTGIIGFKPSYGAISRYGLFAFATSLDTVGYFAHSVEDVITTSNVLFDKSENDLSSVEVNKPINEIVKPKSVGIFNFEGTPEYTQKEMDGLKQKLEADGIEVKEVSMDKKLQELIGVTYDVISFSEASSNDANLTGIGFGVRKDGSSWDEIMLNSRSQGLGSMVQRRLALGALFQIVENQKDYFIKAQQIRATINKEIANIFKDVDFIINPTTGIAPLLSEGKVNTPFTNNQTINNFVGNPSISLPWAKHEEMPYGLSISAPLYKDKELLSVSLYFEKVLRGDHE